MRSILSCVALVLLVSCAQQLQQPAGLFESSTPDEVGATHFAVTSVTPMAEVEAELQPNFAIDERSALAQVLPPTMRGSEAQTEITRFQLGAGYFQPSDNRYDTGGRGGRGGRGSAEVEADEPPTRGTRGGRGGRGAAAEPADEPATEARSRGGRGSSGAGSSGGRGNRNDPYLNERDVIPFPDSRGRTESQLVATPAPASPFEVEPQLKYTLATSLIQYVRLTNRFVRDMVHLEGYEAYVVRVQIGLMPLSRQAQYDTYVDVAFLPNGPVGPQTPKVVPLLSTDSLEGLLQSKTNAEVRDLALQLRALVSGVGGGIDAQRLTQTLDSISGQDLNSLLTVGRASDNVLRVRLGAAAQPSGRFVMIPRTYTVPVVLLVPKDPSGKRIEQISAVSKTVFINALTGKIRRGRVKWNEIEQLGPVRDTYELFKYPTKVYELSEFTRTGDYTGFVNTIREADGGKESSTERLGKLWLEALSLRATEAIQAVNFPLPPIRRGTPPPAQTAVMYDDGTAAVVSLRGGTDLDRLPLAAALEIRSTTGGESIQLRAESHASRTADQRDIQFRFPSPMAAGIQIESGEAAAKRLVIHVYPTDVQGQKWDYPVLYVPAP